MVRCLLGLVDRRSRSDRGNSAVEGLDTGWKRLEIGKISGGIGLFGLLVVAWPQGVYGA
jgi:hypothetical protein